MRYSAVVSPRHSGAIVIPHKVVGGHREDCSAPPGPLASLASHKSPVSRKLENDPAQPAQRAPKAITHDLRLCCSPTCSSKLCRGCVEEHCYPKWSAGPDYDSETASVVGPALAPGASGQWSAHSSAHSIFAAMGREDPRWSSSPPPGAGGAADIR